MAMLKEFGYRKVVQVRFLFGAQKMRAEKESGERLAFLRSHFSLRSRSVSSLVPYCTFTNREICFHSNLVRDYAELFFLVFERLRSTGSVAVGHWCPMVKEWKDAAGLYFLRFIHCNNYTTTAKYKVW
jgi:hypothetical protein